LSLNPFKWTIPWYQKERANDYFKQAESLPPHAWSVADRAHRLMREGAGNQSVLISGESGAGKTEAAKTVLFYLCQMSTTLTTDEQQKNNAINIGMKIQDSSPILEAFGNAKTINNDNSSRFGKYIKLLFNRKGVVQGADIVNCTLLNFFFCSCKLLHKL